MLERFALCFHHRGRRSKKAVRGRPKLQISVDEFSFGDGSRTPPALDATTVEWSCPTLAPMEHAEKLASASECELKPPSLVSTALPDSEPATSLAILAAASQPQLESAEVEAKEASAESDAPVLLGRLGCAVSGLPPTTANKEPADANKTAHEPEALLLGRYRLDPEDGVVASSIRSLTRSGTDVETGNRVAVKFFYADAKGQVSARYLRHVSLAKQLRAPLRCDTESRLWHSRIGDRSPSEFFAEVLDFRDESHLGGSAYIVTRLGQGNLQAWMDQCREAGPASSQRLAELMDSVLLCVAALHLRGFAHLDLQASKFVFFDGQLKLTGFGDCRKMGSKATLHAFVPLYASPELREHITAVTDRLRLVDGMLPELLPTTRTPRFLVDWTADCWSVGMVLCQLATLDDPEAYRAEDFCRDPAEESSFGAFTALTLDMGATDWYDKFFEWACSSARAVRLVEDIVMALCAREPQFRFSCAEFLPADTSAGIEEGGVLCDPVEGPLLSSHVSSSHAGADEPADADVPVSVSDPVSL